MSIKDVLQSWESEIGIVFAILIGATILYKVVPIFLSMVRKADTEKTVEVPETVRNDALLSYGGQLKLINVDEKTAALIIAIVSHETGIPLSQLQFKSIKALNT